MLTAPEFMFRDRADAGERLARRLLPFKPLHPVLVGLPRGGVVVAAEIARVLDAPLDFVSVRKVGAPFQPEFAVAAVTNQDAPNIVFDPAALRVSGLSRTDIQPQIDAELVELARRERVYRTNRPKVDLRGRFVIVVDDGIATGATVRAALDAVRKTGPGRLVLAIPVAPRESLAALWPCCDEVVCLLTPAAFTAVGEFYHEFDQVRDAEVTQLLQEARARSDSSKTHTQDEGAQP